MALWMMKKMIMLYLQATLTRESTKNSLKEDVDTVESMDTKQWIAPTRKAIKIKVSSGNPIRNKKSNNQTYIHLYTGSLIHNYIYGRSLSGDHLSIIIPFCVTRTYASVNQHTSHLNLGWMVCLSVLI